MDKDKKEEEKNEEKNEEEEKDINEESQSKERLYKIESLYGEEYEKVSLSIKEMEEQTKKYFKDVENTLEEKFKEFNANLQNNFIKLTNRFSKAFGLDDVNVDQEKSKFLQNNTKKYLEQLVKIKNIHEQILGSIKMEMSILINSWKIKNLFENFWKKNLII